MTDERNLLAGLNMNLFPVLEALLRHRSATRAAEELGVTQSAVSHSLRDLRLIFGDPLFVRTRRGMEPTVRALGIELELRRALKVLGNVVEEPGAFDPGASSRRVVISTADDSATTVLPGFVAAMMREAPGMSVNIRPRPDHSLDLLERGHTDLLLNLAREVPAWAERAHFYSDTMSVVVCARHPEVKGSIDFETYLALPHVRVAPEGFGASAVEGALEGMGVTRRIVAYTHTFAMAPELVLGTRAVLTLPTKVAAVVAARVPVQVLKPPVAFPSFSVDIVWHRSRDDASLAWVRSKLVESARG